ncbi:hypothetical protein HC725_08200 [Vibrio sp. S17_S38]|uniref:hypothetical protein n=1 Tax=Vibrio sp. S17_S38 TaxID=2720229 RepID=UPI0016801B33|nr:hypothetical protein [Vibrio sp. S17_S38]MBD1573251.1 hypothetical protein [Vibrio sp. S17_S38]
MLKRALVLSLVLSSSLAAAATLSDAQQANINDFNAKLETIEATATKNLDTLNKQLDSASDKKEEMQINTKIKFNEMNKANAEKQLASNKAFTDQVASMTDEQVDSFNKKIDDLKAQAEKTAQDLKLK